MITNIVTTIYNQSYTNYKYEILKKSFFDYNSFIIHIDSCHKHFDSCIC